MGNESNESKESKESKDKNKENRTIEMLDEYYKLKSSYETNYYNKYISPIISSKKKTKKEKHMEYSKLPKPECINCKRPVGTIFNIVPNDELLIRTFKARCGDTLAPCELDIQIQLSNREKFYSFITESLKMIDEIKLSIIKNKNNALFFNEDVTNEFEDNTESLKHTSDVALRVIESNILKNNNPEKIMLLKTLIDNFSINYILPYKQMMSNYIANGDRLILNSAVLFYINDMIPKLKQIRDLTYDVNVVEYDTEESVYHLFQLRNSIENMDFFYKVDDKVLKFVIGTKLVKQKTLKQKTKTLKQNTKTLKQKK
jgi:hypothetical protein